MQIKKNIILNRLNNKPIVIDTFYNSNIKAQPLLIFAHGYKGFKDWGAWNILAKEIANSGFCFVKFNFSHNGGTIEQPIDFPDLEAFGNNNYTKELDDLEDVINWSVSKFKGNVAVNNSEIYLIGHSRGGGISIIKSAEDLRVKKLITLASICDFGTRSATTGNLKQWKNDGVKYIINGRTKQKMPHYIQFYEDYIKNETRLNIEKASKKLSIPHLVIHGDEDTSIEISEAKALHSWSPKSRLKIIKKADHVFNVRHPWRSENLTKALKEVTNTIIEFLQQ